MTYRARIHSASPEFVARDGRPAAEMLVTQRQVHVRKSSAAVQRSKAAAVECTDVPMPEAPAPPAPPGMKIVTRSERKPADRAKTSAKAEASAPAEE